MSTTPNPHSPETTSEQGESVATAPSCNCSDCRRPESTEQRYYSELIRIVAGLFVGLLALMTFLLTVGLQHPHVGFSWALYTSIGALALNLIAYVFGHLFQTQAKDDRRAFKAATVEGEELTALKTRSEQSRKRLKVMRLLQQILFVAAVLAVTALAVQAASFFFTLPPASSATPAPQ